MKEPIIERLQGDAQAIHKLADARLSQLNLEAKLQADLPRRPNRWPWAMAAAVCLLVLTGILISPQLADQTPQQTLTAETSQPLKLDFQQLPAQLEQSVHQPLVDEQQAIMEDLKTLRKAMLSI
jgi:predicted PurR-regulated permease PerM